MSCRDILASCFNCLFRRRKPAAAPTMDLTSPAKDVADPPTPPPLKPSCCACTTEDVPLKKACRLCSAKYCTDCLKTMFTNAINHQDQMPAKCCLIIPIHFVSRSLSKEDASKYRLAFQEWNTDAKDRIYCPKPTCSAFIPLPAKSLGTVISCVNVDCAAKICTSCKKPEHPDAACTPDAEQEAVRELVKKWGYKECPRCGNGVRRMYGCSHMQCKCGAHWCWGCRENINECGGCADDDYDEEESEEYYNSDDDMQAAIEEIHTLFNEERDEETTIMEGPASQMTTQERIDTPQPQTVTTRRERTNYDARPADYWQHQDIDFGDEPGDDELGIWGCDHSWENYKPDEQDAEAEPECHKCWNEILLNAKQGSVCLSCGFVICMACRGDKTPSP